MIILLLPARLSFLMLKSKHTQKFTCYKFQFKFFFLCTLNELIVIQKVRKIVDTELLATPTKNISISCPVTIKLITKVALTIRLCRTFWKQQAYSTLRSRFKWCLKHWIPQKQKSSLSNGNCLSESINSRGNFNQHFLCDIIVELIIHGKHLSE